MANRHLGRRTLHWPFMNAYGREWARRIWDRTRYAGCRAQHPHIAETPSGKGASDENFPVGSILLPKHLRPHVAIFYAYARAIDDIADNPGLDPEDKVKRLDGFDKALLGENMDPAYDKAHRIRQSLAETDVPIQHCRDLISAFKQDAVKLRYDDWPDLIHYCDRSAAPVGRYLLDLHGESRDGYPANDALCNALQVLNHLQDFGDDYRSLDRIYMPGDWMSAAGVYAGRSDGPEDVAGVAAGRRPMSRRDRRTDRPGAHPARATA